MNPIIKLGPSYTDIRGKIQMILEDTNINSVSIITSKPNTLRASHFHLLDSHFCLVIKGKIFYYERPVGSNEKPILTVINNGQLFYTAPNKEHEMFFSDDTDFICFSTLSRKSADYEKDTTRLIKSLKEIYEN